MNNAGTADSTGARNSSRRSMTPSVGSISGENMQRIIPNSESGACRSIRSQRSAVAPEEARFTCSSVGKSAKPPMRF